MNSREKLFLAGLGSGLLPKAPGTWGSLVGLVFGALVYSFISVETLFLLTVLVTLFGVREIDRYESRTGIHDDKRIVIDEVAGIWFALCFSGVSLAALVLTFIFFRLFDIWKPSIIGKIDREAPGGWGVMGDDLVAGAAAGLASALLLYAFNYIGFTL